MAISIFSDIAIKGVCCPPRLRGMLAKLSGDRTGIIAVQSALLATTLLGMAGLSVDAGNWYYVHRAMQSAADAAAIGGARELEAGFANATITSAAKTDAGLNGFSANTGATINVAITATTVTVNISQPATLFLAGLFVKGPPTISTTATATVNNGGPICILATSPNQPGTVAVNGNTTINAAACSLVDNSTSPQALTAVGNATIDTSKTCGPGGVQAGPNVSLNPQPSSCGAIPDPFANLPPPPNYNAPCDHNSQVKVNGTQTLSPGVYCGGISVSSNASVTLQPGIYVIRNGGLSASGNATITGNGVGFYLGENTTVNLVQDDLSFSGNSSVQITAPSSGPMAGFVLYQHDPNASPGQITSTITGNGRSDYNGVLYFGNQNVTINGNGANSTNSPFSAIVANQVFLNGNGTINFNSKASRPNSLIQNQIVLSQ